MIPPIRNPYWRDTSEVFGGLCENPSAPNDEHVLHGAVRCGHTSTNWTRISAICSAHVHDGYTPFLLPTSRRRGKGQSRASFSFESKLQPQQSATSNLVALRLAPPSTSTSCGTRTRVSTMVNALVSRLAHVRRRRLPSRRRRGFPTSSFSRAFLRYTAVPSTCGRHYLLFIERRTV